MLRLGQEVMALKFAVSELFVCLLPVLFGFVIADFDACRFAVLSGFLPTVTCNPQPLTLKEHLIKKS